MHFCAQTIFLWQILNRAKARIKSTRNEYFRTWDRNLSVCRVGSKAVLRALKPPDSTEANPLISCSHRFLNGSASLLIDQTVCWFRWESTYASRLAAHLFIETGARLNCTLNYFTRAKVSLAIASSSFVGITITLTLESGVEITISFPLTLLASSSILMPR